MDARDDDLSRPHAIAELCRASAVGILYAFGSRGEEVLAWVRGERETLSPGPSDVDIGAKLLRGRELTVRQKVELAIALEDLLGVNRVDLVVLDEADPFVAANVIRGERLYAANSYVADEYDLYVLRRAGDLAPLERERMDLILGDEQ